MRYRRFEPLGRDLSVIVLGTACYQNEPLGTSLELLDAWRELGGNTLDAARHYGNAEAVVGRWLSERDLHGEVVVVSKGGHYDLKTGRQRVTPADIEADLEQSLALLGVDAVDLYFVHRDDPALPAAEIAGFLESFRRTGRVRALGASNWTTARLEEAAVFDASSPELSLAAPTEPPWPGCVSIHSPDDLAWYERTQLPVFSWSSQAAGYFVGVDDARVARVYGSSANEERLRRARELGERSGFTANQVALAWVLHQPFPIHAVIGPVTVEQLEDSVRALEVELTDAEVRWLDLEGP